MENHKKTLFFDGLTPVFFEKTNIALRFHALSLRSRSTLYATDLAALYAATLDALTIFPRKARRDPIFALEYEAPLYAYAYDTPPFAIAL